MKRRAFLSAAAVLLLLLSACGQEGDGSQPSPTENAPSVPVIEGGGVGEGDSDELPLWELEELPLQSGSPHWSYLYHLRGTDGQGRPFLLQLPRIEDESEEAAQLNEEIEEWFMPEVTAYLAEREEKSGSYLQLLTTCVEWEGVLSIRIEEERSPVYGTDGVCWTANYQTDEGRRLSLEELLEADGWTEAQVRADIEEALSAALDENTAVRDLSLPGAYLTEDGAVVVIVSFMETPEGADPWQRYWRYEVESAAFLK